MAQRTTNLYSLVKIPGVYKAIQWVLAPERSLQRFVHEVIKPEGGQIVLDVGCGPARLLRYMSNVDYTGLDINQASVEHAKTIYGNGAQFIVCDVSKGLPEFSRKFDVIIVSALLHHLDDDHARALFRQLRDLLAPSGRIVTIDNVWLPRQNPIAKIAISMDSGMNVRTVEGYRALAGDLKVDHRLYRNLLRIPYDHVCLTISA
jgi:SAM-dependent methyltransferase